jgi:putrescine transport system permease protein
MKPAATGGFLRRLVLGVPFLWLAVFFLLPFLIILGISLAEAVIAIPPYSRVLDFSGGWPRFTGSLDNYRFLLGDAVYLQAFGNSLRIALVSTLLALLIGYPLAFAIARTGPGLRSVLLMLVVIPSWTSFLIRVYAWMGLLAGNGYINNGLMALGLVDEPLQLLRTDLAVYVGIVYTYLPFMVLPLYTSLVKLDWSLVEAAMDLGAGPWRCFREVILPLTRGGIIAGCLLVFIPATGEFVIPELLGGADTLMIGKVLWQEFFNNRDWPVAAAVAVSLLLVLLVPIGVYYRFQLPSAGSAAAGLLGAVDGGARRPAGGVR